MAGFLRNEVMNFPEPSGSSPPEKPPGINIIWVFARAAAKAEAEAAARAEVEAAATEAAAEAAPEAPAETPAAE